MKNQIIQNSLNLKNLETINISYIEHLYKKFLMNPNSIDINWKLFFEKLPNNNFYSKRNSINFQSKKKIKNNFNFGKPNFKINILNTDNIQFNVIRLINAFRCYGYLNANLDPLGLWNNKKIQDLNLSFYKFTKENLQELINISSFSKFTTSKKLIDIYYLFKRIYCSSIGVEYMHLLDEKKRSWIQNSVELSMGSFFFSKKEKISFLNELTKAECIEHYFNIKFPCMKRFSLEGSDVLILILKEIILRAGDFGVKEIIIGMPHRGRLNVLSNIFKKKIENFFKNNFSKNQNYSGDVEYHKGFLSNFQINEKSILLELVCNPSHLEIVNPVMMGITRARIDQTNSKNNSTVLPITLHGDASITGQGVVQETLNMSKIDNYDVGGTIRIVINNQIGFTTSSHETRSTQYCTDVSKIIYAPIFHVNADDPEAVVFITRLAFDFRKIFKQDVFIDLVCYRRHGHYETDNPFTTHPFIYKKIQEHPSSRKIYAKHLDNESILASADSEKMVKIFYEKIYQNENLAKKIQRENTNYHMSICKSKNEFHKDSYDVINNAHLQKLARIISIIPENIKMQPQVEKIYYDRVKMAEGTKSFDWGGAEMLSYATIIDAGISIRLSGEDTIRGTFFHRHATIYNQLENTTYTPMEHIHNKQGSFNIWNSVLSEEAALAFEYGYSVRNKTTLVIWEAQFGDFANGAQIVIDQFICSGEQKWGQKCGIVMLLPHGYEGQGPEHSSARLERYLQLSAQNNIQVCIPSTPAQIFHLLRRQALHQIRKPLIILSPKSLLRHPMAISSLYEITYGKFYHIIDETDNLCISSVKQVIICSGKIYYDLVNKRNNNQQTNIAILRIEQLYPFPTKIVQKVISVYKHVKNFIWCQEEPKNQGAWYYIKNYLKKIISKNSSLSYIGRNSAASPAVGCLSVHQDQQEQLINHALEIFCSKEDKIYE